MKENLFNTNFYNETTKDNDGKPYKTQTMKYKQGIETEELVTEKGKINKYTNEYTFDKTGNWITQKSYKNGEIYFNTERDIAYYTK